MLLSTHRVPTGVLARVDLFRRVVGVEVIPPVLNGGLLVGRQGKIVTETTSAEDHCRGGSVRHVRQMELREHPRVPLEAATSLSWTVLPVGICVAPTLVTHGHTPGKLGLNWML